MDFHLPGFRAGVDEVSIPRDHPTRGGEELVSARVFHAASLRGFLERTAGAVGGGTRTVLSTVYVVIAGKRPPDLVWE